MTKFITGIFLVLAPVLGYCQYAEADSHAAKPGKDNEATMKFINEAAKGGMQEVKMGEIGKKASSRRVRNYAAMMVRDHSKANKELKSLAAKHNMKVNPGKMDMAVHNFQNKSGPGFDKDYMDMMVADHRKDIRLFEEQSKNGTNQDFKTFATRTLPTLQMHLDSAEAIRSSLK